MSYRTNVLMELFDVKLRRIEVTNSIAFRQPLEYPVTQQSNYDPRDECSYDPKGKEKN